MYGWELRVLLRHYLEQGFTITAIAERVGVDRRTIQRWIAAGQLDIDPRTVRYGPRPPVVTKLDPYKAIVRQRLETYPELTAVRLFDEIQAAGYRGSLTQLKVFVRRIRPRPEPEPLIRFETPPGKQAQLDFARFQFPWGRRYALIVVLGYSRLLWLQFYPRQTMLTLIRGLEDAFQFFGGVPQEILFDQMKAVIVEDRRPDGGSRPGESRVSALRRSLGLPDPRLPPLPRQDQRQSRAADRLRAPELRLRAELRRRCRSQCPGPALARDGGQCPHPRHHQRAASRPLPAR